MKLNTTVTIREDWSPQSLRAFDLGDVSPKELCEFLEKYMTDEALVVQIQLWNREKIRRKMEEE